VTLCVFEALCENQFRIATTGLKNPVESPADGLEAVFILWSGFKKVDTQIPFSGIIFSTSTM